MVAEIKVLLKHFQFQCIATLCTHKTDYIRSFYEKLLKLTMWRKCHARSVDRKPGVFQNVSFHGTLYIWHVCNCQPGGWVQCTYKSRLGNYIGMPQQDSEQMTVLI